MFFIKNGIDNMYKRITVVNLVVFFIFYGATYELSANEINTDEKIISEVIERDEAFEVIELKSSGDVCRWVTDRFDYSSGELKDKYEWKNVSAELLKYPKEYYGYIKYLAVDIDNDGKEDNLAKVTTYLGGTLSALELVISEPEHLFNYPVSVHKILSNSLFWLNEDGRSRFRDELNKLKKNGIDLYSNRDFQYGFSAYKIQHKSIDVFRYQNKNYVLLNNYHDPYSEPNEEVGLVVSVNTKSDGSFYNKDICFFKLK